MNGQWEAERVDLSRLSDEGLEQLEQLARKANGQHGLLGERALWLDKGRTIFGLLLAMAAVAKKVWRCRGWRGLAAPVRRRALIRVVFRGQRRWALRPVPVEPFIAAIKIAQTRTAVIRRWQGGEQSPK